MGFDYVVVRNRPDMVCPQGHQLTEFQTKDGDCSLDTILIDGDKVHSAYGDGSISFLTRHGCGEVEIYTHCDGCGGYKKKGSWNEFTLIVTNFQVVSVTK